MAPRTSPKRRNSVNRDEATSSMKRRSGEQPVTAETIQGKSPTRRSLGKSSPKHSSVNDRLFQARKFLHSEDPSTSPVFATEYRAIQSFIDDLASAKVIFDINVYNDVKAMLRVHGERLLEHQRILPLTKTAERSSPSSPSKVFTDDLAYEGPSSASTAASQKSKTHEPDEEQEHPWQEGELLIFEPRPFGSKAPGYSRAAPKEVMGFDPELGFVRRSIRSSEEEIFPSAESAKKRVLDKGFAQLDFSNKDKARWKGATEMGKKKQAEEQFPTVATIPRIKNEAVRSRNLTERKRNAGEVVYPDIASDRVSRSKTSPTKGKDVVEEILYPRIASSSRLPAQHEASPTQAVHQSKKPTSFASPQKRTSLKASSSTPAKRSNEAEFDDPITLSSKRIKFHKGDPELMTDKIVQEYLHDSDCDKVDTTCNADDIEMKRFFEVGQQFDGKALEIGNNNGQLPMEIKDLVEDGQIGSEDESEAELSTAARVNDGQGEMAAVAKLKDETTSFPGFSSFATKFFHLWRAEPKQIHQSRRKHPEFEENLDSAMRDNPLTGAGHHADDRSPVEEGSRDDSPEAGESDEEDYFDEDAAFVPLASQPSFSSPKPPMSGFLKKIEEEEASQSKIGKSNAKASKTAQPTPYGSQLPELAIVLPTPPTAKSLTGMQQEVVSDARTNKPKAKISHEKQPTSSSSTLPVPVTLPLSPPPSKSFDNTRGVGAREAGATLTKAAGKYFATEETMSKGRKQREAIMKEAKAIDLREKAKAAKSTDKMQRAKSSKTKSLSAPDIRLPTPPMSCPPPETHSSNALAAEKSMSSSTGPYGHFGLIPPEIANATVTYPSPSSSASKRVRKERHEDVGGDTEGVDKHAKRGVKFWPGDPVFLFGETRYLTALKSRQIEKDLASNDKDVQAQIDSRPLMGMFARYRLPDPPAGWNGFARERGAETTYRRKQASSEKVAEGRVQKKKRPKRVSKKDKSTCLMS
ncbi:MAG: hypothetical protein Q9213_003169 [Squamulea squamosa]